LNQKEVPRPEYPRPQFARRLSFNLNGEWEFAFDDADEGLQLGWQDGRELPRQINFPSQTITFASYLHRLANSGLSADEDYKLLGTPSELKTRILQVWHKFISNEQAGVLSPLESLQETIFTA
jgi:hypothetical protein